MKRFNSWLTTIVLFIVVFTAANIWATRNNLKGDAPNFSLSNLNAQHHSFDFKTLDKPVLLHFFATWCPICELENGSLININKDHQLIMIAMQSGSSAEIKKYADEHQLDMAIYNDETGQISKLYKVVGVPTSFIINKQGKVSSSTIGYTSELGLRFRLWLSHF